MKWKSRLYGYKFFFTLAQTKMYIKEMKLRDNFKDKKASDAVLVHVFPFRAEFSSAGFFLLRSFSLCVVFPSARSLIFPLHSWIHSRMISMTNRHFPIF